MKKLSNYAIQVSSDTERNQAIAFFKLASKRRLNSMSNGYGRYVGMNKRTVNCSNHLFPHEIVLPFNSLNVLADTKSREVAYCKALKKS